MRRAFVAALLLAACAPSRGRPSDADLMRGYHDGNPASTLVGRREQIAALARRDRIVVVDDGPHRFLVREPDLTDGDRGFVWVLDDVQVERVLLPALAPRAVVELRAFDDDERVRFAARVARARPDLSLEP